MKKIVFTCVALACSMPVLAQSLSGAELSLAGSADIRAENDQAIVTFLVEEQDKDKAVAASRVNQKMKLGTEILKREDPQGQYSTRAYYSYPVYAEVPPGAVGAARKPQQIGWRSGQYLELKTTKLQQLPATAAAAQKVLALNGISFGLSEAATTRLEAERIAAGYRNFTEKLRMVTAAMGKKIEDVQITSLSFDGAANEMQTYAVAAPRMLKASRMESDAVAETSFEPGTTQLSIRVAGKIIIK
ncbi:MULTISPECIES: SIMPL domain-containing protein [unclassified Undibacterium]|uniref:SIMPL domain-containing protein n=1 Tax=unclassified Undibacterium TaxID=2630295 RepID=UPI002AC94944|nr:MULTISPECIES: SIMPL domain-containing protein [unclassified Undibacterium]MEB0139639.1 SIMPL domain-containing protein [Undibacterium sp. CCC2.1]MEB0171995.1 SIMPL domain-containing protein [Undibacterium sp. CCC1.1]MEB0176308.1 SIMPL domain-containing protein [Undibacterium sp. CCC3.4]MEB0213990.1 SIMPL domain-containing protein [Undibacterium sp. 5I2]WPX43606.1 SIMPL domain-containing protein [Undibacterium sp. CCC3.4]